MVPDAKGPLLGPERGDTPTPEHASLLPHCLAVPSIALLTTTARPWTPTNSKRPMAERRLSKGGCWVAESTSQDAGPVPCHTARIPSLACVQALFVMQRRPVVDALHQPSGLLPPPGHPPSAGRHDPSRYGNVHLWPQRLGPYRVRADRYQPHLPCHRRTVTRQGGTRPESPLLSVLSRQLQHRGHGQGEWRRNEVLPTLLEPGREGGHVDAGTGFQVWLHGLYANDGHMTAGLAP